MSRNQKPNRRKLLNVCTPFLYKVLVLVQVFNPLWSAAFNNIIVRGADDKIRVPASKDISFNFLFITNNIRFGGGTER